mmetsp:Transcript_17967/g.25948  ORF Transcript_17967/g.25948 Transcript_17967/m.25948 type:complete len:85 (+) Transcript_17967:88-342(+)
MEEDREQKKSLTLFQVSKHKSDDDLYVAVHDRVYNLSQFWRRHPGGEGLIREREGKDVTAEFEAIHHSKVAQDLLRKYEVASLR